MRELRSRCCNSCRAQPFPFPWTFFKFLDAFPESAHLRPCPVEALDLRADEEFDLVILPYQVWFLAPSQPIVAFLADPIVQRVLRGKPVVIAGRVPQHVACSS